MDMPAEVTELNDTDLVKAFDEAKDDLGRAAASSPNSDWHQACFAATYLYASEMSKRGLKYQTVN
jgi:hypothetical protein